MTDPILEDKKVVVTGGTGSLGQQLTRRILTGASGTPERVIIFSRDEARQHQMRLDLLSRTAATDEIIFDRAAEIVDFAIGDIRNVESVTSVLRDADIVFNAAAMKQVPTCEYFPYEATKTNIEGAENIVWAIQSHGLEVETVVGISTDKACKPVNVMGMTKAIQERIFTQANIRCNGPRFVGVRYGNVLASRGSVIPLFHDQIRRGGPVTITTSEMTRFLLSLDDAVDTVLAAVGLAEPGEILVPDVPSALITNVASALIANENIDTVETGIRPGEKVHEILVSGEEARRTVRRDRWIAIQPLLPELGSPTSEPVIVGEYSSSESVLDLDGTWDLLERNGLLMHQAAEASATFL